MRRGHPDAAMSSSTEAWPSALRRPSWSRVTMAIASRDQKSHPADGRSTDFPGCPSASDALQIGCPSSAKQAGRRPGVVGVAADQDVDLRPAGADAPDHVAQHERHLGPVRGLAGAQDHRDRLAGDRLVDVDRQEAAPVVVGVEERELLVTVDPVLGVVDVEHDPARHLRRSCRRTARPWPPSSA